MSRFFAALHYAISMLRTPIILFGAVIALTACKSNLGEFRNATQDKLYLQVFEFNEGEPRFDQKPESNEAIYWAKSGPASVEFAIRSFLEKGGVSFPDGSFISMDWASSKQWRTGSPYQRSYIVIANTAKNLEKATRLIREKMKGRAMGARTGLLLPPQEDIFSHP